MQPPFIASCLGYVKVLAGPWATQTLADLGAEVIKIERVDGGDDARKWGLPFLRDQDGKPSDSRPIFTPPTGIKNPSPLI